MLELGLKSLLSYLLGTLLGSLLLGWFKGVDIRALGSGNAGATNALRTQGKAFGVATLALDVGKGVAAVQWIARLHLPDAASGVAPRWLGVACGAAVILGHVYPVWFGFKGGKGVATVVGVIGALAPMMLLPLLAAWLLVLALSGFVGLASMLAGLVLVLVAYLHQPADLPLRVFCITAAAFVIYTHRANIARMAAGTEHRMRRSWWARSRTA